MDENDLAVKMCSPALSVHVVFIYTLNMPTASETIVIIATTSVLRSGPGDCSGENLRVIHDDVYAKCC